MIKSILTYLGYVKIPIEIVQASMLNEDYLKRVLEKIPDSLILKKHYECQKTITEFLRIGRAFNSG